MNSATSTTEQPQTLELMVADYLLSCRARGLARSTTEDVYGRTLRQAFLPWCDDNGIGHIGDVDQSVLDRFTAMLLAPERALSPGSVHTYMRSVRQFLNWIALRDIGSDRSRPHLPAIPRMAVTTLTPHEISRLHDVAETERDRLIVRLLAETGMRVGELCALTADDIEQVDDRTFLRVRGKGRSLRLLPVAPDLARRLQSETRRQEPRDRHPLFASHRHAAQIDVEALTPSGVRQMFCRLAGRAGISRRIHPHLFRHTFATEALRCGMDSVQLAAILGHSGVAMIEKVYAHLTATDAHDAVMAMLAVSRVRNAPTRRPPLVPQRRWHRPLSPARRSAVIHGR